MSDLNLTQKLINVQKELKAPKGQRNDFGKYNYRSAEDILEAVKPLNAEFGLLLTITDEAQLIGDWHYIKATATITDGKDSITVSASARESENKKGMDSSQITGAASSYARKYALNGLYCIDDTKDADTNEYQNQNKNQSTNKQQSQSNNQQVASDKQLNYIQKLIKDNVSEKFNEKQLHQLLKERIKTNNNLENFTPQEASAAIKFLNNSAKGA
ncbi:ERF family protein [Oceanobacillus kimchii]|uniref:ERF family protein n=1 Tax=Oceanobacillus kimchii TaxID=746691 RepID=UPI003B02827C